jgi:hypothetical protein
MSYCVIIHRNNYANVKRFVSEYRDLFEEYGCVLEFDAALWSPTACSMLELRGLHRARCLIFLVPPDHGSAAYLFGDEGAFPFFSGAVRSRNGRRSEIVVVLTSSHSHIGTPPIHWPEGCEIRRLPPLGWFARNVFDFSSWPDSEPLQNYEVCIPPVVKDGVLQQQQPQVSGKVVYYRREKLIQSAFDWSTNFKLFVVKLKLVTAKSAAASTTDDDPLVDESATTTREPETTETECKSKPNEMKRIIEY